MALSCLCQPRTHRRERQSPYVTLSCLCHPRTHCRERQSPCVKKPQSIFQRTGVCWFSFLLLVPTLWPPLSQKTVSSSWSGQAEACKATGGWFSKVQHPHPVQMSPLLWSLPWPSSSHSLPAQEGLEEWITSSVLSLLPARFCLSFYPTGNGESLGWFHLVSPRHQPMRLVLVPSTPGSLPPLEEGHLLDFPGSPVVENPPASAGAMGSIPGLGGSHMPQGS